MDNKIQNTTNYIMGAGIGYGTYKGTELLLKKATLKYIYPEKLSKNENLIYWDAGVKAHSEMNTDTIIRHIDKNNLEEMTKEIREKPFKYTTIDKIRKFLHIGKEKGISYWLKVISDGANACFSNNYNEIWINKELRGVALFHELGHSINFNSKGTKKFIHNSKKLVPLFAPAILFAGLLTNKPKKENPQEQTKINKTANFLKKNCGYLTALFLAPIVIEEGLASYNGAKLAKKYLNKFDLERMERMNAKSLLSYISMAVTAGLAVKAAVMARDGIVNKNQNS